MQHWDVLRYMSHRILRAAVRPSMTAHWCLWKLGSYTLQRQGERGPLLSRDCISEEWLPSHRDRHSWVVEDGCTSQQGRERI